MSIFPQGWAGNRTINTGSVGGGIVPLYSSGLNISIDLSSSNNFSHMMIENTTLGLPTGIKIGQTGTIIFSQNPSAAKTIAFNTIWKNAASASAAAISTTPGATNIMTYVVESLTVITYGWANKGIT